MPKIKAMNFYDFIIIYLACGAPFGVFYFVNHRNQESRVLIRTFLITIFWIPFAFGVLKKAISSKTPHTALSKQEILKDEEINEAKKNLERVFLKRDSTLSIFELREVFERYIGLTLAQENQETEAAENSLVFKAAGNQNFELASKCHQRRNRKLLSFHQTLAGQDFLNLISDFVSHFPNDEDIENFSLKMANILEDKKMEKKLRNLFKGRQQSAESERVLKTEKEKWTTDLQKQSPVNSLQASMNQTVKITLPIKD